MISTGLVLVVKDESFDGFHELGKVLVSTDFSESIFRSQDSGNAPCNRSRSGAITYAAAAVIAGDGGSR